MTVFLVAAVLVTAVGAWTDWRTGQPRTNVNVILCTHIQVVYSGVNVTSPSTCAQANFA